MNETVPKMTALSEGARLLHVLPYIEAEMAKLDKTQDALIFQQIDQGTLTPEAALTAWMNKRAYRRVLKGFQTRVQLGIAAGEEMSPLLNQEMNNG